MSHVPTGIITRVECSAIASKFFHAEKLRSNFPAKWKKFKECSAWNVERESVQ